MPVRARLPAASLALLLPAACVGGRGSAPASPPSPTAPPAIVVEVDPQAELTSGQVVVPSDAWLYAAPGSDIRFRFRSDGGARPLHDAQRMTILADHGDWLELEAGRAPPQPACVDASEELHRHGLRVFVAREQLAPLTTRTVELSFADGTGLRLRPGTPIGPARAGDGWRAIETVEARFHVPVPIEAIGISFAEWGPAPREYGDVLLNPAPRLEFAGGERLALEVDEYSLLYDYVVTQIGVEADGRRRVEIDATCFTAVVLAEVGDVRPPEAWGIGGLGTGGVGGGTWYEVGEGATVYWADGSEAGRRRAPFSTRTAPSERGSLRCFTTYFGSQGPPAERGVELCYAVTDVQTRPPADVGGP